MIADAQLIDVSVEPHRHQYHQSILRHHLTRLCRGRNHGQGEGGQTNSACTNNQTCRGNSKSRSLAAA